MPAVLTLGALAVLVSLGNWQVRRLAGKEQLIDEVAARSSWPPVDLINETLRNIGDPQSFLELSQYRTAILKGKYEPAGEVLVFTSLEAPKGPLGGPGYWVLTPLVTPASDRFYVNRGFVPQERKADYTPPPTGEVTVHGLIRSPELGSWFTPDPDLAKRIFYARDIARIAEETGRRGAAGFYIDLAASEMPASGLPQAGETFIVFTNNHLQYAVTWYGLAAALLAVFATYAHGRVRRRDNKPA